MKKNLEKHLWKDIFVYLEYHDKKISSVSLELIGEAYRLCQRTGEKIYGIAIGEDVGVLEKQLQGYPLSGVYAYERSGGFCPDAYEKIMTPCIQTKKPSIVLIGGTLKGRSLAPRLAVASHTGLTADCLELELDEEGDLIQTRPAFGGNIMASIVTKQTRPQLVTLREGVVLPVAPGFTEKVPFWMEKVNAESSILLLGKEKKQKQVSITEQKLLIVTGRGVKKKEDLVLFRNLAEKLGGGFASSRALVEKGWALPEEQIGLSGNTVSPDVMIAFGISGTVQFMAGMRNTKNIIAVNNDPNARIFQIAHHPICADLYETAHWLMEKKRG